MEAQGRFAWVLGDVVVAGDGSVEWRGDLATNLVYTKKMVEPFWLHHFFILQHRPPTFHLRVSR